MTSEELSVIQKSAKAEDNKEQIIQYKFHVAANYLKLAGLLNENHRDSLYKLLGCDSWEEFLGMPEIGIKRSTAYNLIKIWRLYKEKMGLDDHTILDIDYTKLLKIAPVVESNQEEWLGKAKSLSVSDLTIEIDGREPGEIKLSPPPPVLAPSPMDCINGCGPGEKHHWPITRGAGGKEVENWWIPLCRVCHSGAHQHPRDWAWDNKRAWARYLYGHINRGE